MVFQTDVVGRVNTSETFVVTWDSKDATSCTSDVFETGGKVKGSLTVGPLAETTTMNLTCSNSKGVATKSVEVLVNVPASHLECISNTCSPVAGAGENTCASSGSSCQSGAGGESLASLINFFKGQGIQVDSGISATCLGVVKSALADVGSKGKLNKLKTGTCGISGAYACMRDNGEMGVGSCPQWAIYHELIHSLYYAGSIKGAADAEFGRTGGRTISQYPQYATNATEMAAYGAEALYSGDRVGAEQRARSQGIISQFNFIATLPGTNAQPIAQGLLSPFSRFASLLLSSQKQKVLGVDAPDARPLDGGSHDAAYVSGPGVTILSHQNGAMVTTVPVSVSGEATNDFATHAAVAKIRIEINRIFATDITPSSGTCIGGLAYCKPWSASLNLKSGANEVRVIATDVNGVDSQPSVIMLNVPDGAGAKVSGATTLSLVRDPLLVASTTPAPHRASSGAVGRVASRVSTGLGEGTLAALVLSALVSLLYTGYTRTGLYRRNEVERIVEQERIEGGDMNFSKPEDQ
jgi:hypothetical protein